ncbi:hypothetical protein ABT174_40470 [Streptomyces sparsogenes]|uniref:hypothetical protein n=1 Tax=Streptomyces sparsogenes TaxID=67365 RepID=UPI003318A2B9
MSEPLTCSSAGPLPEQVAALLDAVVEALDIPAPATYSDREQYREVLDDRALWVIVALKSVLLDPTGLAAEWMVTCLRERLAEHPPTSYRAWDAPPSPRPSEEGGR